MLSPKSNEEPSCTGGARAERRLRMNEIVMAVVHGWSSAKDRIESALPVDNVLLHIVVGMALYWAATVILTSRRAPLLGWTLVLVATFANEAIDLLVERWPNFIEQLWEGTTDIVWTMTLPSVALLLTRPPRPLLSPVPDPTDCSS